MVMHVEVYHEDSFLSNSFNMPNDENVQVILIENGDTSMRSIGRDTSNTCGNVSLDNTRDNSRDNSRQTVNTEHSILDLTKEEEEDDEDDEYEADRSVLFQDLHSPMPNEEEEEVSLNKHSLLGKFSLHKVTDTFVDSLCRATSGSCAVPSSCSQPCAVPTSISCVPQQRLQIGTDVWNLLGCSAHPGDVEMDSIWQLKTKDVFQKRRKPVRASITSRMQRIRRLRAQRWSGATRYGVTIASTAPAVSRAHTMDDPLADLIGQGMDPIPHDDGYDSDPEFGRTPAPPTIIPEDEEMEAPADVDEQDHIIHQTVQQTMNATWTLTWHPNPQNVAEFGISDKPLCINIWMERGTVITNSGIVVEPTFMWRDAYQPRLSQRKLNASTQKPWSMRLLNTCRIAASSQLDRTLYPLARQAQCLVLRTCNNQEFLLEATSPSQARLICERWKLAVARFASLAVTEDIDAIAKEFFHPTMSS